MGKVNVLSDEVAHLIAAGEVVQRPVSVVKEMVENAVDAGATQVSAEIRGGGMTFIKISDNGSGILKEDVPLCLMRHATSKIASKDDLESIHTLGFRGEALAAISSVCRLSIITCAREESLGTSAEFEGGKQLSIEDAGCPVGTTMVVRDLFFNTPARMKFMKKDATEAGHIGDMMERLALSHPDVAFTLIRDGRTTLKTSGNGKVADAIYNIYGREFYGNLLPVDYNYNGMTLKGYIVKPVYAKSNRGLQSFFLNGRYVKNKNLMFGLEESYKDSIMTRRYPACVLYITADSRSYDVNVHPEKTEVKFARERDVYDLVYYGCKTALTGDSAHVSGAGAMKKQAFVETEETAVPVSVKRMSTAQPAPNPQQTQQVMEFIASFKKETDAYRTDAEQPAPEGMPKQLNAPPAGAYAPQKSRVDLNVEYFEPTPKADEPEQTEQQPDAVPSEPTVQEVQPEQKQVTPYRIIGEAFATYLIVEQGESLLLIDKHAAHERILYEKLKQQAREHCGQLLLEPVTETMSRSDAALVLENLPLLAQLGFEAEEFGENSIMVRQVPMGFEQSDVGELLGEVVTALRENRKNVTLETEDNLLHSMACKAAIKAHQHNAEPEREAIVQRILEYDDIKYCPHGRPVCIEMTKYAIEKQFGRIV